MKKIRAAIFGGSGYGGAELIRILLLHKNVELGLVTANRHAGTKITDLHKNLSGFTNQNFQEMPKNLNDLAEYDVVFFALPHGQALNIIPNIPETPKIIDLSGDFRIDDLETFKRFYKFEHTAPDIQREFVYGLTETNRALIGDSSRIANPGCFATATLLALAPLVANNLLSGDVVVDAKTGSSGSGITPAANTHHPQRMNSFYAYKPFTHQHMPEISQHLKSVGEFENEFIFMTHSLPVTRGIFASCYVNLNDEFSTELLEDTYRQFYRDSPFIRIVKNSPDINWVKTTNFCDIAVNTDKNHAVIFSAIDNLVKGAAGQAVQNMNIMFELAEDEGLRIPGTNP
ncbi:MAG: N-acetyl-gamma-glutamyl-phosphate reductase [Pyrinomonadaceae bacterium]